MNSSYSWSMTGPWQEGGSNTNKEMGVMGERVLERINQSPLQSNINHWCSFLEVLGAPAPDLVALLKINMQQDTFNFLAVILTNASVINNNKVKDWLWRKKRSLNYLVNGRASYIKCLFNSRKHQHENSDNIINLKDSSSGIEVQLHLLWSIVFLCDNFNIITVNMLCIEWLALLKYEIRFWS